ncbi:MAG: GAF domain-containing protein [Spirochaetes bacterium]|nr:GAF domain-containing protein [Spirochaetota bacterium]
MRKLYFIFSFIVVILLFLFLYFLGVTNLKLQQSEFLEQYRFFDFGNPVLAIIYLIVLTIFFILITSIMIKLIFSEVKNESKLEAAKLALLQQKQSVENTINQHKSQKEKKPALDSPTTEMNSLMEKIDEIYLRYSNMVEDIYQAATYSEVFEKALFWSTSLTQSQKGSIMLFNKTNELYIYKITGRRQEEKLKLKEFILPSQSMANKVALGKKRIFVENIDLYSDHQFLYAGEYESRSFISQPIIVHNNVIGVLNLTDHKNKCYRISDLEAVNVITMICCQTLEILQHKKKQKII